MESETIDLTDPLEELLKKTNWTPECLNERLSFLTKENSTTMKSKGSNITLNELLEDHENYSKTTVTSFETVQSILTGESKNKTEIITLEQLLDDNSSMHLVSEPPETIELSDDEECTVSKELNKKEHDNIEHVTEVQVIEVSDFSNQNSNSDQNDEDDFFEELIISKSEFSGNEPYYSRSNIQHSFQKINVPLSSDFELARIDSMELTSDDLPDDDNLLSDLNKKSYHNCNPVTNIMPKYICMGSIQPPLSQQISTQSCLQPTSKKLSTLSEENTHSNVNHYLTKDKSVGAENAPKLIFTQICSTNTEKTMEKINKPGISSIKSTISESSMANTKNEPIQNKIEKVNCNNSVICNIENENDASIKQLDEFLTEHVPYSNTNNVEKEDSTNITSMANADTQLIGDISLNYSVDDLTTNNEGIEHSDLDALEEQRLNTNIALDDIASSNVEDKNKHLDPEEESLQILSVASHISPSCIQCKTSDVSRCQIHRANNYDHISLQNKLSEPTENNSDSQHVLLNESSSHRKNNTLTKLDEYKIAENDHENSFREETTLGSSEEIRKNLILQLTSLRTRKKMDILQDVKQTLANVEKLHKPCTFNKVSEYSYLSTNNEDLGKTSKTEININIATLQSEHMSPALITTNSQSNGIEKSFQPQDNEDVPNVLNEIRKIIKKPKSFFTNSGSIGRSFPSNIDKLNANGLKCIDTKDCNTQDLLHKTNFQKISKKYQSDDPKVINNDKHVYSNNPVSSPFVSNSLDEFLTDSKLNVSYIIPKSGAEEGLRQVYSVEPVINLNTKVKDEDHEKLKQNEYKPKTLAEKRRIMEKNKIQEERRFKKLKTQENLQRRSYVLFKNKKIFLRSKTMGNCIASIESDITSFNQDTSLTRYKKPSLLTEFYRKSIAPVKYKPGPLSKKYLLQSDYSQWITELKSLPRVELNVMPQLGKPVHHWLLPIICQWNGEITENQMEFALSALSTKPERTHKIFKFDVKYEKDQDQLLVRRKIFDKPSLNVQYVPNSNAHSNVDEDVIQVLENLIKYVEIKEIAPTLIKDDDNVATSMDVPLKMDPIINSQDSFKKKTCRKLSRTSKELLRLNCKVVSMEVKENEPKVKCSKSYCRLGCLCKSLRCETVISLHCQKIKCLFGCSCPKERNKIINISEPHLFNTGTELSMDTVSRIENQAKKNLAKEEKEFTQTVIYANDKTIVVGAGNKPRRAARAPKKYTDFFDEDILNEANSENKKEKQILIKPCIISLDKWDFSDIIPFCLVHHLYQCHCKGYSIFPSTFEFKQFTEEDHSNVIKYGQKPVSDRYKHMRKLQCKLKIQESINVHNTLSSELNENTGSRKNTLYSVTRRPLRKKKKTYKPDFIRFSVSPEKLNPLEDSLENGISTYEPRYCSRTRKISMKYRKSKPFTSAATSLDFANNITDADIFKSKINPKDDLLESDRVKCSIIQEKKILQAAESEHRKKHQRKQQIEVRQDEDLNIKINVNLLSNKKPRYKVNSVFRGEIIVNDSEWLKKLCNNANQTSDSYARILPWMSLLNGFLSKSINVYCICEMPLRLLLNVGPKLSGDKIIDIETCGHNILETPLKGKAPWLVSQSENVRDIIKWLLSGTLSSKYKATSLSFLLVETLPGQFEVRGLCTQNENTGISKSIVHDDIDISDEITEIKHKNMNNQIESLFITKGKFRLRELVEDGFDDDLTDNLYMWVGLPEVYKVAKWRVIFLKNDFAYLYFKKVRYSIKYTDLVKLTEIAKEEEVTLLIRNLQIRRSYEHSLFGLYVSPKYSDRIFIGPYFIKYDTEDIDTLKYMNQSLISSESLQKMKGHSSYKCGYWMYERQRSYYQAPKTIMKETIDLTKDGSVITTDFTTEKKLSLPQSVQSVQSATLSGEQIINHNGFPIHIKNSKPRAPSEFNR